MNLVRLVGSWDIWSDDQAPERVFKVSGSALIDRQVTGFVRIPESPGESWRPETRNGGRGPGISYLSPPDLAPRHSSY